MNTLKKPVLVFLVLAFAALAGGCSLQPQKDTSIPWSRPAGWEGQIPGMGTPTGSGR